MQPDNFEPLIMQNDERHETLKGVESLSEAQLMKQDEISEGIRDLNLTAEQLLMQGDEQKNQSFEIEANDANSLALWNLLRGPKGNKGDKGDKGDTGENAVHNPEIAVEALRNDEVFQSAVKGEKGDQGEQGPAGFDGRDGMDGRDGLKGMDGAMGMQGVQGEQGPRGERGLRGFKGDAGRDGKDVDAKTVEDLKEGVDFAVKRASKTVSLVELDDVNLSGLTQTNGKYNLGSGGEGGGQVNTVVAGTGISVNSTDPANPIVTNTAPDQTVTLTPGTNITSVTGTYPNFTINAATQAGGSGTVTNVSSVNADISVANPTTTPALTLNSATTATASTIVKRDASNNIYTNNIFTNATSTVSAGGTTILTIASSAIQRLTGSSTQTFQLPDATTVPVSAIFEFDNNSSGSLIITNAGATTLYTLPAGGDVRAECTDNGTANGVWDFHALAPSAATWSSGATGLVFNTALTTTPMVQVGASSSTAPSFIPQRGANTTGFGGDGTNLYATIAGTARATISASGITATNLSGTNTGDQATIVGITGTKAQFNTAVTDGDIVYLDSTDTITGVKTMSGLNVVKVASNGLTVRNPGNTFDYTITGGAIAAARTLNLPVTTATDTLATLGLAQTYTATQTFGTLVATTVNGNTITTGTGTLTLGAGKTLTANNSITLAGTDATTMTFPATSKTIAANDGTNFTMASQATGDLVVASSGTAVARLADVGVGQVLTSGGVGAPPAYSANPQVTTIELGAATDTTLARQAAGVISVEGVVIPSISSTNTLTNKRITIRTGTTTSSATPTINSDNVDLYSITAQTVDITSFTTNLTGTPTHGQSLIIEITGTAARAITWGASFEASTVALPTTTVTTAMLTVGFKWNSATSKWRCLAVA